jgi:polar amino acid transport system substrate-binding protein
MVFKQGRDLAGAEVDLARALGEHLKRPVTFVELPWADQIPALRAGRIDIIMSSLSVTPSRAYVIDFSQPYMIVAQSPLVRREDQNAYTLGIAVDTDQTLGALKATTGEFLVQRDFPKARRKVFSSPEEAAQALRKKKIDLFIADSTLVWYLAGLHATDGLAAVPLSLNQEQVAWGIRKGNDDLLQRVNAFLDKTTKDGSLNRTLRRWMAVPP